MNYSKIQGHHPPHFAMNGHFPDCSETTVADENPEIKRTETDNYRTWNWVGAAAEVGVNESTLRKVWWEEEVEPAFRHSPTPLRVVTRIVKKSGRALSEFTPFGIEVLKTYKAFKEKGDHAAAQFLAEAKAKFPVPATPLCSSPSPAEIPTKVTVEVESGNHKVLLTPPVLPQSYTLEGLRHTESIEIEDPLAIAAQFLQAADQVQAAMEDDIEQREQKLQQTRRAKTAIAAKAQELKLEQRLYRERANQVAAQTSEETQALQEALSTLQSLGKSPSAPGSPAAG